MNNLSQFSKRLKYKVEILVKILNKTIENNLNYVNNVVCKRNSKKPKIAKQLTRKIVDLRIVGKRW